MLNLNEQMLAQDIDCQDLPFLQFVWPLVPGGSCSNAVELLSFACYSQKESSLLAHRQCAYGFANVCVSVGHALFLKYKWALLHKFRLECVGCRAHRCLVNRMVL